MKNQDMITILAGAILAYVAYKTFTKGGAPALPGMTAKPVSGMYSKAVNNTALPGQPGFGWDYYDNGVAIAPDGTYYLGGEPIWSPS